MQKQFGTSSNWFDFVHYTEIIIFSKNVVFFLYSRNIFYEVTFENIFRILKNTVCFQNSVVCHKPFKVITFFCVKFAPVTGIAKEL